MAAVAALPSAISSLASMAMVNENASPGIPWTAIGLLVLGASRATLRPGRGGGGGAASGWVQVCVRLSGLYWKTMTLGSGTRNVGVNSTSAPLSSTLTGPPPRRPGSRRHRREPGPGPAPAPTASMIRRESMSGASPALAVTSTRRASSAVTPGGSWRDAAKPSATPRASWRAAPSSSPEARRRRRSMVSCGPGRGPAPALIASLPVPAASPFPASPALGGSRPGRGASR